MQKTLLAAGVGATIIRELRLLSQLKSLEPLKRLLDPKGILNPGKVI